MMLNVCVFFLIKITALGRSSSMLTIEVMLMI